MKKICIFIILLFLWISKIFAYTTIPAPFEVGEYMEFEVRAFGVTVAVQKVWVENIVKISNRKCYHIIADIETVPWVSKIYHLHDIAHEYIDVKTLRPVAIRTKIKEGSWTNTVTIDIYEDKNMLRYRDTKKAKDKMIKYEGNVLGLISLLYYARSITPEKGEKIKFTLSNGDKINYVDVVVKSVNSPLYLKKLKKKFKAFLYEQQGGKNVALWISNDKLRLPIRMISVKIKIAGKGITNIEGWLTKYYRRGKGKSKKR